MEALKGGCGGGIVERGRPQKEENVSCIFWRSWELGSLCPFHIKSVMCTLIEARVKHELRVIFHLVSSHILQFLESN